MIYVVLSCLHAIRRRANPDPPCRPDPRNPDMTAERIDLERESHVALHTQIAEHFAAAIRSGALPPGRQLEPEHALARRFGVSRITVRQALHTLADTGLVLRKQGKGTYVNRPTVQFDLHKPRGFFDLLFDQGRNPQTRLLFFGPKDPGARIDRTLALAGRQAMLLQRLYLVDGQPIAVGNGWLGPEAGRVSWADADSHSTAWILRKLLNAPIAHSEMAIRADVAGKATGGLLNIAPRKPILVATRTSYDAEGRGVEFAQFFLNSEAYEFTFGTDLPESFASSIRLVSAT
jgi:GntR family transcriptional regulator